jgi:hypothetical protein
MAAPGERIPLTGGYVQLTVFHDHVRAEEHGHPATVEEMNRYSAAVERVLTDRGLQATLILAEKQALDATAPRWIPIRAARWRALGSSRARRIAVVVEDDLAVTRVQMTAVAERAPVRAFLREADALNWLRAALRPSDP